jgi:peptidyl-prolyl cis-trans isomerase D
MMLKTMRQNTKIILWIILIAFVGTILFAWGMNVTGRRRGGSNTIGVINGQKITYQQFSSAFQNLYTQTQERMDEQMDMETFRRLRDETWNRIVNQILLAEEIKKRNITVTDEELLHYIKNNPPPYIMNNEALQTDGRFDPQKYAQVLADPRYDWRPLENQYRAIIPMQKLQNLITATVRITDAEVLEDFKKNNEKVQVRYVAFQPGQFSVEESVFTEEAMRRYYREHQEDFLQPRQANLDYVLIEKTPGPADEDSTRAELNLIRERILAGEDFAELAKVYSQGPTAAQGGDLGFFGRGVMDSVFESTAFALATGEISEPVRSAFGWHIIKVEEKKKVNGEEQVRARHILLKVLPGPETLAAIQERIKEVAQRAKEVGLQEAAEEFKLEVKQTGFFRQGGDFIPGLGRASDATLYAFSKKPPAIGGPFENESGAYVVSLRERKEAGVPPLAEIADRVRASLKRERQQELARQQAEEFRRILSETGDLGQAASQAGVTLEQTKMFSRRDYVPGIGEINEFVGTAFGLPEGGISNLVETTRGFYFLEIVAREEADLDQFAEQKETLKIDLLRQKQNQAYSDWFDHIRAKADIKDYRDRFFTG